MVEDFNLNFEDGEVAYIGWRLDISKIVINYWNYFWKKKGFAPFLKLSQAKKSHTVKSYKLKGGIASSQYHPF